MKKERKKNFETKTGTTI